MKQRAVEMTDHGRGGKPKAGFPPRPQSLEIANSAIPTFPQPRRGAGKWKTKSTFSTFPLTVFAFVKQEKKGGLAAGRFAPAFRLILRLENTNYSGNQFGNPQRPDSSFERSYVGLFQPCL
jgi:hypothetical protein